MNVAIGSRVAVGWPFWRGRFSAISGLTSGGKRLRNDCAAPLSLWEKERVNSKTLRLGMPYAGVLDHDGSATGRWIAFLLAISFSLSFALPAQFSVAVGIGIILRELHAGRTRADTLLGESRGNGTEAR